jgi:hypothetical protein
MISAGLKKESFHGKRSHPPFELAAAVAGIAFAIHTGHMGLSVQLL